MNKIILKVDTMFSLRDEYAKRLSEILRELEKSKIKDLNSVIVEIKNIEESGFYEQIYNGFYQGSGKLEPKTKTGKEKYLLRENYMDTNFQIMGLRNLSRPPLPIPILTDLICFPTFFTIYPFLETVYYINLNRPMDSEDIEHLHNSKIDERLSYYLNEFDIVIEPPEITDSFFIKLKEIKWETRQSKKLFNKLKEAMKCVRMGMFGKFHIIFSNTERDFLLFLAACSSIKNNRSKINQNDVVTAYKTYFKLIKTDIPKFITASKLKSDFNYVDKGYLVCNKCNGYYKLQSDESPDDFSNECECGGKLNYYATISATEHI